MATLMASVTEALSGPAPVARWVVGTAMIARYLPRLKAMACARFLSLKVASESLMVRPV
jgi:hypothetical protein